MTEHPKVLLLADLDPQRNPHALQRRRALERLGCRVTEVDLGRSPGLLRRVTGGGLDAQVARALTRDEPDLVLLLGAPELEADAIRRFREGEGGRAVWANWLPFDLASVDQAIPQAAACDHCFAIGSDVAAHVGASLGREVGVLPLAADPSVYRPHHSRDQYRANVVFAGRATPRREALLAEVLEFGLALRGPGWRQTSLRDYCRGEALDTEEFVRAYGGASVAINIHERAPGASATEGSCNQRLFEIAAIGVPQVVDRRGDLPDHYTPGVECFVFDEAADLKSAVEMVLLDPPAAQGVAEAARRTTLTRHTYMHRVRELLRRVGCAPDPAAARSPRSEDAGAEDGMSSYLTSGSRSESA